MDGDGGWGMGDGEGRPNAEGSTEDFQHSETRRCTLTGDTCFDTLVQPTEAPRTLRQTTDSDNDVPTQIQTAMSAPHPGRLLQWRTLCVCSDRRRMETLYSVQR